MFVIIKEKRKKERKKKLAEITAKSLSSEMKQKTNKKRNKQTKTKKHPLMISNGKEVRSIKMQDDSQE